MEFNVDRKQRLYWIKYILLKKEDDFCEVYKEDIQSQSGFMNWLQ